MGHDFICSEAIALTWELTANTIPHKTTCSYWQTLQRKQIA